MARFRAFSRPSNRLSMHDLLTDEETTHAAAQGWLLSWVYDLRTRRLTADILPVTPGQGTQAAIQFVVNKAKQRDAVALRALQLVTSSRQGSK
jgi:hypothetical protein